MFDKLRQSIGRLIIGRNSMSLPQQFLRYGNRKAMYPDWSQVMMDDKDHYTGYSYGAITKRARVVARVASQFLTTELPDNSNEDLVHPYIPLIKDSKLFSENMFWQTISTYLDLEGVFYLMAIRAESGGDTVGKIQQLKLLNPYNITRIIKKDTLDLGGYIETRRGFQREIPANMIIEIKELNPFDETKPYAMTDAAREHSYTLKSSGDYTRHALRNNVDAPGIITTDVILDDEQFKNFVARMKDHTKGEPVFGNGAGAIKWQAMNIDLGKAGLKDITEINREALFAVTGMSKTLMGIEESGTTRETAHVQTDLFMENEAVPRINLVLDALNLDYKNHYPDEYTKTKLTLGLENPIQSDQDVEGKKVDNSTKSFELFTTIVDAGYEEKLAAQFAYGEITLEQLGKPTKPPKPKPVPPGTPPPPKPKEHLHDRQLNQITQTIVDDQQSMLQNAVVNIEGNLTAQAISRIPKKVKNDIENEADLITPTEKKSAANELAIVLAAFYGIIATMQGEETIKERIAKYGGEGKFLLDKIMRDGIKETSKRVAENHVDTVAADLYKIAREAALAGKSQQEIISEVKTKYSHDITENRAKTVARTETNRAFTMAQFEADRQFIDQNELTARAFKKYETRSDNPCPFCLELEAQGLIPFDEPFIKKGGSVSAEVDGKKVTFDANFEDVVAGNLHPNCSCDYRLIIIPEKQK